MFNINEDKFIVAKDISDQFSSINKQGQLFSSYDSIVDFNYSMFKNT